MKKSQRKEKRVAKFSVSHIILKKRELILVSMISFEDNYLMEVVWIFDRAKKKIR
jgi:hypothetical protein